MNTVKGIMLDYGGTVDTNGIHWAEVFWAQYEAEKVPVSRDLFREAYKFAERTVAVQQLILPHFDFEQTLRVKIRLQLDYLLHKGALPFDLQPSALAEKITAACDALVRRTIDKARPVLEQLTQMCPLAVVSNFYGNLNTVLTAYNIRHYFLYVVESAVVNIRKPDPAIFLKGVELLGCQAAETVVAGDTYSKDIVPAKAAGCRTIWLKGQEWETTVAQEAADHIIAGLEEMPGIIHQILQA
ncbi:MAG: HAD family hydrolase [Bacteroidales bacterium]|jgi:putative hydrolase of the HAD superfamily|nr:HAD family hydrolase [Bacteroidales bacterium]